MKQQVGDEKPKNQHETIEVKLNNRNKTTTTTNMKLKVLLLKCLTHKDFFQTLLVFKSQALTTYPLTGSGHGDSI